MSGSRSYLRPSPLVARVVGASAVLGILVAAAFTVLVLAVFGLRDSAGRATRAKDVTTATLELEKLVLELEGGLRGFVITNDERFLEPFSRSQRELPGATLKLDRLVADDPMERTLARDLGTRVRQYVRDYAVPLVRIARRDPVAARASVATTEGKLRLDAIRRRFALFLTLENAVATERSSAARGEAARAVSVGLAALTLTGLLVLGFAAYLATRIARPVRKVADAASRLAGADLSARLVEEGPGEVRDLTRSFNVMADSLERGQRELESQNEELRRSERVRSELASIVSHELRTPLSSVLGYSSLLLERDFDEPTTRHYLELIHAEGQRISSLVDDLVDLRRAERGALELERRPLDLATLLREQVALLAARGEKPRFDLLVRDEPLTVSGDVARLEQVVANLLANAAKYSPNGDPVEVVGERRGAVVRVEVRDRGMGIATEDQPQVFTKFFRGESRASGIAGAGLGLALSREIMEAHGGRIDFSSVLGAGSTFWFELPGAGPGQV